MATDIQTPFPERSVICPVLVGRHASLDTVRTTLDRVRDGQGRILLVAGEAGIGKSRLLRETASEARARGFLVLQGACFEADRAIPFAPLLDLVRGFAGSNSAAVAAHALAPAAPELVRAFPELASIFPNLPPLEALDPEHERRRLFHAIAETMAALSRTQPVLLTIEDLHWGDEASLELLRYLARRLATQPVALTFSYRSDEVSPSLERLLAELDRTRLATELVLARFSEAELTAMLSAIFDGAAPGGGFGETLFALTEGNPFFVEEVLKALVSAGDVMRRADGVWYARPLGRIQAPRTAVEAVRRRLSALTVPAREVASVAAVIGRRFDFAFLQSLTGHDERTLLSLIRELISAQLVTEETPDRFAFRHALTREAIVGELLARERAALHRAVADELERRGGASNAHIESLAYHAYGAMDWARALAASTRAAEHALLLHAPREALAHLDRAKDAAERAGITPGAQLLHVRGRTLETIGDLQGAHDNFTAALETARASDNVQCAWEALHALGLLWAARDYARAGEYRREALALARTIGDDRLIARSLNRVANWHVNIEQPAPALRGHREALSLFERLGDARGVAETVDLLAMTHFIAGDLVQSAANYRRALALHEALGDARGVASSCALLILCNASIHVSCTGSSPTARSTILEYMERSLRMTRDIGWRAGEAFVRYLIGDSLAWRGEYDQALPLIEESLSIAVEMSHLQWECGASRALGMLFLDLEAPERARATLERAHGIATRLGSRTWIRWSAAPLAMTLARLGDHATANALIDEAFVPSPIGREALLPGDEDNPTLGERYLALARAEVALEAGDAALALTIVEARILAERAAAASHDPPTNGSVPRLTFLRARALLALEQLDEAERALVQATYETREHEGQALLWRVQAALAQLLRKQGKRLEARKVVDEARHTAMALAERIGDPTLRAHFAAVIDGELPSAPLTPRQEAKAAYGGLTSRERDVARLVAQGKANRAIARALGIGERTVEGYVAAALAKLGFSTRSQLAAWTVERGLGGSSTGKQKAP